MNANCHVDFFPIDSIYLAAIRYDRYCFNRLLFLYLFSYLPTWKCRIVSQKIRNDVCYWIQCTVSFPYQCSSYFNSFNLFIQFLSTIYSWSIFQLHLTSAQTWHNSSSSSKPILMRTSGWHCSINSIPYRAAMIVWAICWTWTPSRLWKI